MTLPYYDAHNHLQDSRLQPHLGEIIPACEQSGVRRMVVNGSCEDDWPAVARLAASHRIVLPSYGYHPWYVMERSREWRERLTALVERRSACLGEIGLDRWIKEPHFEDQLEVFRWQFRLATRLNLPVSIHCLEAWGPLLEILRGEQRPERGFLLHSFGGAKELVSELVKLGAYFSFSGYFAQPKKQKKRDAFAVVPLDRLLIETDAPDMPLPKELETHSLPDTAEQKPINHPANLSAVYNYVAQLRAIPEREFAEQIERNFHRFFCLDS